MQPSLAVAGLSARQLAQSARRGGWRVHALDLFGDVDTCAAAQSWHAIGAAQSLRIDGERFLEALREVRLDADCAGWIVGAGFEPQPELLETGAGVLPLLGNDRTTTGRVRDPRVFQAALDAAGLAHPETRFAAPDDLRGWLVKNPAGSGGWRIRRAEGLPRPAIGEGDFFQRQTPGRPMSLLFLAAQGRVFPVGINALLVDAAGALPYVYRGAIGPVCRIESALGRRVTAAAQAMATTFRLRGLASLDFLSDAGAIAMLELNPRPSATMALYDQDFPQGLVQLHVEASSGALPALDRPPQPPRLRGELTVYAHADAVTETAQVEALLALGCHDVPQPGSRFAAGAPLCSVSAQASDADAVLAELSRLEAAVLAVVQNRNEVTIDAR